MIIHRGKDGRILEKLIITKEQIMRAMRELKLSLLANSVAIIPNEKESNEFVFR